VRAHAPAQQLEAAQKGEEIEAVAMVLRERVGERDRDGLGLRRDTERSTSGRWRYV
jgi:hypothetical protein